MVTVLNWIGNLAAIAGVLVCVVTGLTRLRGAYYVLGHEVMTMFVAGIALMLFACLAKLEVVIHDKR